MDLGQQCRVGQPGGVRTQARQRRLDVVAVGQAHEVAADREVDGVIEAVVADVRKKLDVRGGLRVIGDPKTRIERVALLPGSTPIAAAIDTLPGVDLIVAGEVREWESVEYVRDVVFSGQPKVLILVGRVLSEEGAMNACASWLTTVVPEVKVRHVSARDPYWRPA